jgi:hypothetical protein
MAQELKGLKRELNDEKVRMKLLTQQADHLLNQIGVISCWIRQREILVANLEEQEKLILSED